MRRLHHILVALFTLLSCSTFDHSAIWDELREHEERIEALEAQCRQLNSNVEALQAVLTALQEHDYITDITKIMEDGVETGYSITFAKGGTITIYHGTDGTEGSAPKIGISKAADGEYYWTSDGEWLTDEDGEKIPAAVPDDPDGRYVTPHFRVSDGRWYVSYDGGNTWMEFSVTANDEDDDIFQSITYDSNHLYITLSDGNVIALPREHEQSEVIYATAYGVVPGEVDASKMQELLDDASQMNKTIRFNDGEYIFGSTVNVPSDVSLIGNTKTVFKPKDTATPSVLMQIHNADNVYLSHIILDGGLTSRPAVEGTQTGLSIVSSRSVNIENVEIIGWSRNGLYSKTMSSYGNESDGKFYKHLQMTNCRFYYNWCGNYFDYRCEYCQVLNCVWGENNIGTTNCGGNNAYTSCQWNANTTGFLMKNGGSNPAHGGCNACTFNHNYTDAIKIDDCVNGWTFEGCQIFYGKIVLNNSKGVIFDGNVWGSCKFFSTFPGNPNQNLITDTYFLTDSSVILAGNDGSTYIYDCLPGTTTEEKVNFLNFIQSCEIAENMVHFSCDDTYACLYDLILNGDTYESIFENSFFASLKRCHDETGACFTLMTFNTHTQVPDYDISKVPSKFQSEFQECQSWLRFAFHAENETTRYATATGILESYNRFVSSIYTLTGDYECIDRIARLGFFSGSLDNVLQIKNAGHGIIGLLTADDTRTSYYLSHEESETARLKGKYYDLDNGLIFIKTLNRNWANAKEEMTTNPLYRKMTEFFWHEYEDVSSVRPWVTTAAQLCNDMGYIHGFPADLYKPIE